MGPTLLFDNLKWHLFQVGNGTKLRGWERCCCCCCCWLLVVVGCCWLLLVVVGCCWLLLVVVGCCWLLLVVVVVVVVVGCCCWLLVVGCCWLLLVVVGCCCWLLFVVVVVVGCWLLVVGCCWLLLVVVVGCWLLVVVGCCCWLLLLVVVVVVCWLLLLVVVVVVVGCWLLVVVVVVVVVVGCLILGGLTLEWQFFFKTQPDPTGGRLSSPCCLSSHPTFLASTKETTGGDLKEEKNTEDAGTEPYKGVSKNRGGPPKWMVKIMENPIKMDDLGVPLFLETPMFGYFWGWVFLYISRIHTAYIGEDSSILGTWNVWWEYFYPIFGTGSLKTHVYVFASNPHY